MQETTTLCCLALTVRTDQHVPHTHNASQPITSLCKESRQSLNWYDVQDKIDDKD